MMEKYKIVLYQQSDGSWAAYIPAIPGCQAVMASREEVLDELETVLSMIKEEYNEKNRPLPEDVEIVTNAQ